MPVVVSPGTVTPPVDVPTPIGDPYIATDLLSFTWTGWNAETWQIQGGLGSSAVMQLEGRNGLGMPPVTQYFTESATTDGATWQGYRVQQRVFDFPVFVTGSTPTEARAEQARFMSTLRPDKVGVLAVADPLGNRRYLNLRYLSGADEEFLSSNYGLYWYSHKLRFTAEQPYYYGDSVLLEFESVTGVNFYGGGVGTFAPDFYIANSQTTDNAIITNPGDVDVWPTWTIHGPFTSFTGTVGGKSIALPIPKTLNHWIRVDSNPEKQTMVDDLGANMWGSAGAVEFGAIPASASTQLGLTLVGSDAGTKVEVEFTPKFWRAW